MDKIYNKNDCVQIEWSYVNDPELEWRMPMKKRKLSTTLGAIFLIICGMGVLYMGYRVIYMSGEKPGKLVSLSTSADNLYYNENVSEQRVLSKVQKVDYDTMKYGYLEDVNLTKMDYMDSYYDNERMEEVRAVNDLTAMNEWTTDQLEYEEDKKQQELAMQEAEKKAKEAEAAALAAEAEKKARIQQLAQEMLNPGSSSVTAAGTYIDVGDSSDTGFGATASNGGAIGPKIMAESHGASLGIFNVTAYCTCRVCCGVYSGRNRTASGTVPTSNRTVAVDTSVIPFGTRLVINGQVYVAEDVGGAIKGNHIDMFFYTHAEAVRWGKRNMEVFYAN